jgi:hypothetical protein
MSVIEINQTADPGAFLVEARSRFLGHYSIVLRFSTPGPSRRGIFLVYNQMFNQAESQQIMQQRSVVEWFSLWTKTKKDGTFGRKRLQKVVFALKEAPLRSSTPIVTLRLIGWVEAH